MAAVDITEHLQLEEERDRLHEQLEGYVNLERTVNRCLEALIPDSGTADVTDEVMRIVSTHELGDACGIYRLEAGEGRAVLEYGWQAAGSGNAAKLPEHLELAPGGDWLERMEKGEVVRGGVLSSSDPVLRQLCTGAAGRPGFRSALASGIRVSERLDGFAVLLFRGGEEMLNKMEDRAIVAISRILSLAAEKRRSLEQLKRSEREKSMIIDHIDTAIMLLDGREHLIKVNPPRLRSPGKARRSCWRSRAIRISAAAGRISTNVRSPRASAPAVPPFSMWRSAGAVISRPRSRCWTTTVKSSM